MTPTTKLVVSSDNQPAMFRPGNQAVLVPAAPTNPSASQSFVPGLGEVAAPNASGNGLDPEGEEILAQYRNRVAKATQSNKARIKAAISRLAQKDAAIESFLDQAKISGRTPSRAEILRLRDMQAQIREMVQKLQATSDISVVAQSGGQVAAPWNAKPTLVRGYQPLRAVNAPATPNALKYAPAGISTQSNQSKIMDMQRSIQPVTPMNGLGSWITETSFGLPNWALTAVGGVVALIGVRMLKKRKA